jgi:hypothetical protein
MCFSVHEKATQMNYTTFCERVEHNTKILKKALKHKKSRISILTDLYTWDTAPGELHDSEIISNAFDILPAAYLGLLANTKKNGTDAFAVDSNNQITNYELKTATIRGADVWKTVRGTLYKGNRTTEYDKVNVRSALNASYKLWTSNNVNSKRIKTVLLVSDTDNNSINYFDAYELDGNTIFNYLIRTKSKNRTIKFGTFYNYGQRSDTVVPLEGIESWENNIRRSAPIKKNGYV